jgi:hypothetical protein
VRWRTGVQPGWCAVARLRCAGGSIAVTEAGLVLQACSTTPRWFVAAAKVTRITCSKGPGTGLSSCCTEGQAGAPGHKGSDGGVCIVVWVVAVPGVTRDAAGTVTLCTARHAVLHALSCRHHR